MLFYIYGLLINAVLGVFLVILITRNRPAAGSRALLALIFGATIWSAGYAIEFLAPDLAHKLFWGKFQYLGITAIPLAWLHFAFNYLGTPRWLERWIPYRYWLAIFPALALLLVWTNELHGLFWRQVGLQTIGPVQVLKVDHGPGFWFLLVFSYLCLLGGSIHMLSMFYNSTGLRRWQISLSLFAVLVCWAGNLLYVSSMNPVKYLDWTPFCLIIAGLLLTISLFRYHLANIVPIAHRTMFTELSDCVVVLDNQDFILDANPAFAKKLGLPEEALINKPLGQVSPRLAEVLSSSGSNEWDSAEFTWGRQVFDVRVTPLSGKYQPFLGRMTVCHEITELKQEQARLEQTVLERTEQLRKTVDQLQVELEQRKRAEQQQDRLMTEIKQSHRQMRALAARLSEVQEYNQRQTAIELHDRVGQSLTALNLNLHLIQNQIPAEGFDAIHGRLEDSMNLVEETVRHVRSLMAELNPPLLEEYGLGAALRLSCQKFTERTGIDTVLSGTENCPRLSACEEMALFRIIQEGLNNVAKHARASRVDIQIADSQESIELTLEDNGQGFEEQKISRAGGQPHWGLLSIQERAASIGGVLQIHSVPGRGTCLQVSLPKGMQNDPSHVG